MKKLLSLLLCLTMLCAPLLSLPVGAVNAEPEEESAGYPAVVGVQVRVTSSFTAYFTITVPEGTESAGLYVAGERVVGELQGDGTYRVPCEEIYPQQMTEMIVVWPWCFVDKTLVRGGSVDFSLRDYAMRLLCREDLTSETRGVLLAMLNYGAAAQIYIHHRLGNLANDYLPVLDRVVPALSYGDEVASGFLDTGTQEAVTADRVSLLLSNRAGYRFYLQVEGQEALRINGGAGIPAHADLTPVREALALVEGYRLEVADNADFEDAAFFEIALESEELDEDGRAYYYADATSVSFGRLWEQVYARVVGPDGEKSDVYFCSAASYAKERMEEDISEKERALLLALMAFGDAARSYDGAAD